MALRNKNQSGITVVEAAIYLPLLLLAYVGFIVISFYITQRVVLDAAVSRACVEAAAFISDEPKVGVTDAFSGNTERIYMTPYRKMYSPDYKSLNNLTGLRNKVEEKIIRYSRASFIRGRRDAGAIIVTCNYENFVFFGELTVNAQQTFSLPIDLSLFGAPDSFTLKSTAKSMVMNADAMINDVDFIFDALRWFGADINALKNTISDLPNKISKLLTEQIFSGLNPF